LNGFTIPTVVWPLLADISSRSGQTERGQLADEAIPMLKRAGLLSRGNVTVGCCGKASFVGLRYMRRTQSCESWPPCNFRRHCYNCCFCSISQLKSLSVREGIIFFCWLEIPSASPLNAVHAYHNTNPRSHHRRYSKMALRRMPRMPPQEQDMHTSSRKLCLQGLKPSCHEQVGPVQIGLRVGGITVYQHNSTNYARRHYACEAAHKEIRHAGYYNGDVPHHSPPMTETFSRLLEQATLSRFNTRAAQALRYHEASPQRQIGLGDASIPPTSPVGSSEAMVSNVSSLFPTYPSNSIPEFDPLLEYYMENPAASLDDAALGSVKDHRPKHRQSGRRWLSSKFVDTCIS
ncbi:uncharacterized protein EI90DRAFT_3166339, partial [Cantharellus anzutake]|uniref:uncharacterized protein n=1 Tax=Cantharellus anzutake TaxID=1750568 RepID=UPI001908CB79